MMLRIKGKAGPLRGQAVLSLWLCLMTGLGERVDAVACGSLAEVSVGVTEVGTAATGNSGASKTV
jgi:hypothetical protein